MRKSDLRPRLPDARMPFMAKTDVVLKEDSGSGVRLPAAGAKFTSAFARRGLVAEHGSSWVLPRVVGPAVALDILLSGRVFLAEEALELGVVNKVFPPQELLPATLAYARDLAENAAPTSMAAMKHQVYAHLETDLEGAMKDSNELMNRSL